METLKRMQDNAMLSSSPAFATPLHPIPPTQAQRPPPPPVFKPSIPTILPILLPPPTLRPLAFRTFTKKHNLTLNSSALQALATFIGRHCGSGWREEGTGEKVLEEAAKLWKAEGGAVIVEDGEKLKGVLKALEGCMSGGRVTGAVKRRGSEMSRTNSFAFGNDSAVDLLSDGSRRPSLGDGRTSSFGMSRLQVDEAGNDDDEEGSKDPTAWLKVISAFEQPRLSYDAEKKHFIQQTNRPSMFPPPSRKTALFKERYDIIYQRLLRNSAFQAPSFTTAPLPKLNTTQQQQQFYKVTPIANLLGRSGSSHLLLAQLAIAPTGTLALNDPSGSIALDLQHASALQGENSSYFCPGMLVLVEGVYEEDYSGAGSSGLGNTGGVGGMIGGRFIGFSIGGPPVEKRNVSLGVNLGGGEVGGGFGWTDFLGLGSERAVGERMRRVEERVLGPRSELVGEKRGKMVVMSEVTLDEPETLAALRKVLEQYSSTEEGVPMTFLMMGNFVSRAAMAGTSTDSIAYKEAFNDLAAVLSDFPALLRNSTWVFVPGDNDPWASAFSAGASSLVPRDAVPDVFTSRIKRAFANAKSESNVARGKDGVRGEALWTSNPARLSLFGPSHEVCVFRDDISGRFRRSAVRVGQAAKRTATHDDDTRQEQQAGDEDDIIMSGALPNPENDAATDTMQPDLDPESETMALDPPTTSSATTTEEPYAIQQAKKLILTLLPQSTLSPFPLSLRPTHWDYTSSALTLYPLPHTLVLADPEMAAFALTFEGCHVLNPGRLVSEVGGRRRKVTWVEYDVWSRRGLVREDFVG